MKKESGGRQRRRADRVLVWFDLEFTTLELERAHLLQAALVVTDGHLRRIGTPADDIVCDVRLPPRARISLWVREHLSSRVARSRGPGAVSVAELDRRLAARLDRIVGPPSAEVTGRPVLAGNSIHADWHLARRLLPGFSARLHYRHLDVTPFKLHWEAVSRKETFDKSDPAQVLRWFPQAVFPPDAREHDAYFDVQASIAELAFYRARLLRLVRKPSTR
jgi:oligoribonuclease (3'-5' exoribonuclease)